MRSELSCTKHTREKGGPVLRRDPTAIEKLEIVKMVEIVMKEFGVESPSELDNKKKHEIEKRFHYNFREQIERWFSRRHTSRISLRVTTSASTASDLAAREARTSSRGMGWVRESALHRKTFQHRNALWQLFGASSESG